MLLHQEEKESEGCHLMVQQSEGKPKGKTVLQRKRKKMRVGTCYFKTYTPLQPIQLLQWPSRLQWQ